MRILKVINNNVVLVNDTHRGALIVTGRGVGFQKRAGQKVDAERVVQVFTPENNGDMRALSTFLVDIPPEFIAVGNQIRKIAEDSLGVDLPQGMVVALSDHIAFAVKRTQAGIVIDHPLRAEVAHLYPQEFAIGKQAVMLVREEFGVPIADDEAVAVAMHLVNALQFGTADLSGTFEITDLLTQIFSIVPSVYDRPFDQMSLSSARFVTHLRYFFARASAERQIRDHPEKFSQMIQDSFPTAFGAAQKVRGLLELRLESPLTQDE